MQTIPSTFEAHKAPGMNDISNPIHNAAAAIGYIKSRYGSINNVPGIKSGDLLLSDQATIGITDVWAAARQALNPGHIVYRSVSAFNIADSGSSVVNWVADIIE